MLDWFFPYCKREEKTNERLYRVYFSKVVWIRIFKEDEPGYLFDMSYSGGFTERSSVSSLEDLGFATPLRGSAKPPYSLF